MGFFDKVKEQAAGAEVAAVGSAGQSGNRSVQVTFASMPETPAEFTAMPQAALQTPFDTAAMFIAALCVYPLSKDSTIAMINYLRGPNPMAPREISFLADRMAQNKKAGFLGASYFVGATPQNDYSPSEPYTVIVSESPRSYDTQGCATLYVKSGGGDSLRPITMRLAKDGKWYLWEYSTLLTDIRAPESTNPWA